MKKSKGKLKYKIISIMCILLISISLVHIFLIRGRSSVVYDQRVNMLREPYGIPKESLSFSWKINMVEDKLQQNSYRIVISDSVKKMKRNEYIFDTNWCIGSESNAVKIKGLESILKDNSLYCWKVCIRTKSGKEYGFSDLHIFTTAVGEKWKSKKGIWDKEDSDFAFFRTEFNTKVKKIEKAILSITASSPENTRQYIYSLFLNGEQIGYGPSRENHNSVFYNTYDITDLLQEKNALGITCYSDFEKAFLCQCTIFYKDGTSDIVFNSGTDRTKWRVLNGDFIYGNTKEKVISTPYYHASAENINGSIYPFGWNMVEFNDIEWEKPVESDIFLQKSMVPYPSENMKKYKVIPEKIIYKGNNHYYIDMGREVVGGFGLDIYGEKEDVKITLHYGEELNSDGTVRYCMRTGNIYEEQWIIGAEQHQSLENLGMKTFRYVEIYDCPIKLTKENIYGFSIRQEFDENLADFSSDSELLNRIYEMAKYTIKMTNQNLYVDSQSRERAPYEGDTYINMLTSYAFSDNYTLARFSNEFLFENRTWPAEYAYLSIICAWEDYMYTGNKDSLESNYEILLKKLPKVESLDKDYSLCSSLVLENGFDTPLVDWPETQRDNYAIDLAYYNTVTNAVAYGAYCDMIKISEVLGKDTTELEKTENELKAGIIKYLYNSEKGAFSDGLDENGNRIEHYSQHATAYALEFMIYSDEKMLEDMVAYINSTKENRMSVYGIQFLLDGLYKNGAGDLATKWMLADTEFSWKTMLDETNATISAEAWNVEIKDNMTFSHPWGAAAGNLIVRGMFGIRPIKPGFDEFQIKCQMGDVQEAWIKVPTVKGIVSVKYDKNDKENIIMEVTVPANSQASVYIPNEKLDNIIVNGTEMRCINNNKYSLLKLKSGIYDINCQYRN